ncbi:MAG TPA: hypothetical protein VJ793_23760 [Anaerolineae bacterium]|nr:hypothetical protein [Anaerolineae bacterium]
MSTQVTYVTIPASPETIEQLPPDPVTRAQVLELGLRQWRIREALEDYRRGRGTLAYAAEQAGVSLREIIPLAYAYGLKPPVDPDQTTDPLSLDQAASL